MSTKEVRLLWAVLVVAVILVAIFILRQESSYTGSLVGIVGIMASPEVSREKIWDFALPADYAYDTSKINLSGGEAKLIPSFFNYNIIYIIYFFYVNYINLLSKN